MSTGRFLTTHVGSLPREQDLIDLIFANHRYVVFRLTGDDAGLAANTERGVVEQSDGVLPRHGKDGRGGRPGGEGGARYTGTSREHGLERGASRDAHGYTPAFFDGGCSSGVEESFFDAT